MALYNRSRQQSDATWRRLTHHISNLSNSVQIESEDSPIAALHLTRESEVSPSVNKLILRFVVQTRTRAGVVVGLLGNCAELGMWNIDHKVVLEKETGESLMWYSPEITLLLHSSTFTLEYKYVHVENTGNVLSEPQLENHQAEVKFTFAKAVKWVVRDKFGIYASHVFDLKERFPLLSNLPEEATIAEWLPGICQYFESKVEGVSLEDFLLLNYLFKYWGANPSTPEPNYSLEHCLRLTELLLQSSTWEVEPLIRSILRELSKCSLSFCKLTRTVLDRSLIESCRVPLGCHSKEVFEFLSDYLNFSPASEQATARTVILNGVRRSLRKLKERSATPELLLIYDIYLEDVSGAYIEDNFVRGEEDNLLTEMHKVTIILEALGLSGVCAEVSRTYNATLESVWCSNEIGNHFESLKGMLLDILTTHTDWLSRYCRAEGLEQKDDPLDLKSVLSEIGARYAHYLFPTLSRILLKLDQEMRIPHYIPLRTGTAVGKVISLSSIAEIPTVYSSVIVILSQRVESTKLPENVKALLLLKEIDFDSKLIAHCQARQILLAIVSEKRIPVNASSCVQVHVFQDSLSFV